MLLSYLAPSNLTMIQQFFTQMLIYWFGVLLGTFVLRELIILRIWFMIKALRFCKHDSHFIGHFMSLFENTQNLEDLFF